MGACVALLSALAEAVVCAARGGGVEAGAADVALGVLHIAAMTLPVGVLSGALAGVAVALLRAIPWLRPARAQLGSRRRLFARDPEAFATTLGLLAAIALLFLAATGAALHFSTRYHDPELAAWAMGAAVVALLVGCALAGAAVRALGRVAAPLLGGLASAGAVLVLGGLLAAGAAAVSIARAPRVLEALDPVTVAWLPGAALAWLGVTHVLRRTVRSGGRLARVAGRASAAVVLLSLGALAATGATYGGSNRARAVVEERSATGRELVRVFLALTDRDRDGHAFAFGGADCDDGRADVYPGAPDVPGDGVDADCFDGDGSRDVADLGDGAFGPLPPGLSRPSFVLVTIDALRPDHLGCYGYERDTSPNLDRFARGAVRFERVVAQSSRSIRSVPSLLTGFYPSQVAYGPEYLWPSLLPSNETFAETLARAGYATAVVMGTDYFNRTDGLFQGFETVEQLPLYKPARGAPMDAGLALLDRLAASERPFFLWVHLFNVHEEYLWDRAPSRFGDEPIDAYDTEIVHADREVQRLLSELRRRGLEERTVVMLASDHGEAFGEHGNRGHSLTLYEEELLSTLLVRVPGVDPGVVSEPVGLFDLAPTILNLAGLRVSAPMPARSLLPLMRGTARQPEDRLLFSEIVPDGAVPYDQKAIRRGDDKLIWWVREGRVQLFDLARDPGERADRSDDEPELAAELLGLLRAWVTQTNRPEQRQADVVAHNRLRSPPRRMTRRLGLRVDDTFTILGFDLGRTRFSPGERIPLHFYYRVEAQTERDFFFYVHIEGPPGYPVPPHFHAHHYPLNGRYRTYEWEAGELLRDPVEIVIPPDIRTPAALRITLSILDERRRRVPLSGDPDGDSVVELAEIEIR